MKYIYITILCMMCAFISCNDDFMQKDPTQEMADKGFFKVIDNHPLYLNTLYHYGIEGYQQHYSYGKEWNPFNQMGPTLGNLDIFSDNSVKISTMPALLKNTGTTPQSANNTLWKFEHVRGINYYLENVNLAFEANPGKEKEIYRYMAEAKFFKAKEYYSKLLYYGEVPWLNQALNMDSEALQTPRMPRKELVDSILSQIDFAVEWLPSSNVPDGRLTKEMALFLKARFCLFEGTFRKYHAKQLATDFNFPDAAATVNDLLTQSAAAAKEIIDGGKFELYKGGSTNSKDPYWKLFTFKVNPSADGHKEAILARTYLPEKGHDFQRYWQMNHRDPFGASRSLVDEYLCIDGHPIYTGGKEGSYVQNVNFKGYDGLWDELDNRDPRLKQTVAKPGEYITVYDPLTGRSGIDVVGLTYPGIQQGNTSGDAYKGRRPTVTGYSVIKMWMGDHVEREAVTRGQQTAIEFRYAEVLLNYAEAKVELGNFSQDDADKTINLLRERAGFDFASYPDSKLTVGSIVQDPRLADLNAKYLDYPVSDLLREVRRERRVEMAYEGLRYHDLMRWRAGKFLTTPYRGMKLTDEKLNTIYGGSYDAGKKNPTTGIMEYAPKATLDNDVFRDTDKFIIGYPKDAQGGQVGVFEWDDRRYYLPIAIKELQLVESYRQNPGWNDIER